MKVGNDVNAGATWAAIAGAIKDAVDVYHVQIITMSYGGFSDHHDGTDIVCQAVDYAVSRGVTVFISAGNNASLGWHYSASAPAGASTDFIKVNVSGMTANTTGLAYNLVWFDDPGTHNQLSLQYFDSLHNPLPDISTDNQSESQRGTEQVYSWGQNKLPAGDGIYYLKVQNNSSSDQFFHLYYVGGSQKVVFENPDPDYTLNSPAEADSAIAVGAYVTRNNWVDYEGNPWTYTSQLLHSMATFSSHGPRVDPGAPFKPEITAPGSRLVSARDNDVYPFQPAYNTAADIYPYSRWIIDNDGMNLNGSGPADYLLMHDTSMACPAAAGVGALLLSRNGLLTPRQIRTALQNTAMDIDAPGRDIVSGYGLIDPSAAQDYIDRWYLWRVGGEVSLIDSPAGRQPVRVLLAVMYLPVFAFGLYRLFRRKQTLR